PAESVTLSGITNPVKEGETKILTCTTSTSNPASQISWLKDNNVWTDNTYESITSDVTRDGDYNGEISEQQMTISIQAEHNKNDIGNTTFIVTFNDKNVPDAPKSVVPITRFYDSLVVTIIPGYDCGDADTTYFVQYRTRRNATFIELNADNSETTNITIEILELDPSTLYECRAYAANAIGLGPYSNAIIIRTLDEPIVELDHDTTTLSWTRHENETYTCVKIETRHVDVTWDVIVKCIDRNILEYKVNDTNREYRITYCTADGFCENRDFFALTRRTSNGSVCGSCSVGIIVGILTTLLVTTIISVVISYVLHKRRLNEEKRRSDVVDDRDYTGLSEITRDKDHTYEIPEKK
ncbi:uncharacterized protein LOC144349762, partial [Saccoglossus kowalevskii]